LVPVRLQSEVTGDAECATRHQSLHQRRSLCRPPQRLVSNRQHLPSLGAGLLGHWLIITIFAAFAIQATTASTYRWQPSLQHRIFYTGGRY